MIKNNKLLWIYILSSSIYFTQGIEGIPGLALFAYMKEKLHLDPSTIMYIGSIIGISWLIKPLWGYLCDNYFTKKNWILISLLGSLGVCLYLGLSPFIILPILILVMALGSWTSSVRDVAVDGIMCVEGKETNSCDKIQSIQWISITVAGILVSLAGGFIAQYSNYKLAYLFLIPIYLIIIGIILNYNPVKNTDLILDRNKIYCIGKNKYIRQIYQDIRSYKELFINKPFLYTCLFLFLYNFNPSFGVPLQFIERDLFKWNWTFLGILGAITSSISIIGALLYFKYGKQINIGKCLFWSVFVGALTTLCYLYFTPISAIIYGIIFSAIGMFVFLNIMTFMAQSTIPGKEATSFALLCSINNLAGTASSLSGAYLYPKIGLHWLIIVSALTSFLCLPLINKLDITKGGNNE